ncbi:MAG: FAD-dependent oxidoreductase [Ignavibacteria bacterium]|nr:FAD-dependent oxidoreductase [Ignavibacteria bacterium]
MAIVRKYNATVEEIKNPLTDIFSVTFSSDKKFKYLPGQFLHLALDDYDGIGQWPESRCFSMQSDPNQAQLKITFSANGRFTKRMADELREGKEVLLKLPYGDFFQRGHNKHNCVFIAGGTGITPFLSLFTDNSFSDYTTPKLYFGVRTNNYNIFSKELDLTKMINPDFDITIVNQDQRGKLDINLIYEANKDSVYFISGPPVMINNFKKYLLDQKISSEQILTDDWV